MQRKNILVPEAPREPARLSCHASPLQAAEEQVLTSQRKEGLNWIELSLKAAPATKNIKLICKYHYQLLLKINPELYTSLTKVIILINNQ